MKTLLLSIILLFILDSYSQIVNIPDINFKAYLVGNTSINTNSDNEIQVSEANNYTGRMLCQSLNITDLTGIESFTQIDSLWCSDNKLTNVNLSQNTSLRFLDICCQGTPSNMSSLDLTQLTQLRFLNFDGNNISTIDLTQNILLERLDCSWNPLTNLDISQNTKLNSLQCYFLTGGGSLTTLDVSNNPLLEWLNCIGHQLTSLDVSQNGNLKNLYCSDNNLNCLSLKNGNNSQMYNSPGAMMASSNPNLTCIEVDNPSTANINWTVGAGEIDSQMYFSTDCGSSCTAGVSELNNNPKQLIKIVDLMGRETPFKPNTVLIYVYEDGTTERVFKLEE